MRAATSSGTWVPLDVDVLLQGLGWVSVVWLLTVDVLVRRGRLPAGSRAFRIAGCAAAVSVVAAGVTERVWPVAVLGLLWLRTEVFGYGRVDAQRAGAAVEEPEPVPSLLVPGFVGEGSDRPRARRPHLPHPRLPHPHLPHVPHPHLSRRFVTVMFRVEMAVIVAVAVGLFFVWSQQQHARFGADTDRVLCNWVTTC